MCKLCAQIEEFAIHNFMYNGLYDLFFDILSPTEHKYSFWKFQISAAETGPCSQMAFNDSRFISAMTPLF